MLSPGMFRDAISKLSLRKKLAILVSIGVVLPLLVLTYLQYRSLAELENKTKGAFRDNLRQGLTLLQRRMRQRLEDLAAQTLNPIGNIPAGSEELERYFADVKRSRPEIEEIFAFPTDSLILSVFERSRMARNFIDDKRQYLFAERYLFYPLPGGFAGVRLSESFVRDDLIARTIAEASRGHEDTSSPAMAITITDENQRVIYSNGAAQNGYLLESNFDRPFSNWKAAVGLKNTDLDYLARNSFLHSAGATVLVLVFLLGGIALTIRATDREARLAQAKSNFVANVSHELKTPLSLLSLFSEILELGRVKNEEKKIEYYQVMRHESRRLNKLIDNILDFSKIEAGRKTYNFADADMADVIENVLSSYRYQIVNSGFDIQTNITANLPPVSMDSDAMAQAISNLLDNSIKYSREVKRLSITAEMLDSKLCVEIEDHGIGIPRAEQVKIFENFYRVGNGLVHDVKGSGLGLSLVKHIVEVHKGTTSLESDVGKGSRFRILLPIAHRSDGV
jgi:signal transduction histidine kinase